MIKDLLVKIDSYRLRDYYASVGQGAIDLVANIAAMILVERFLGSEALGLFAFILSLYFTTGYFAEAGVPDFLEQSLALHPERRKGLTIEAKNAIRLSGLIAAAFFFLLAFKGSSITKIEDTSFIYLLIAISIPIRNGNRLKLALLQGTGNHIRVAGLRTNKRISYLIILFILVFIIELRPEYTLFLSSFLTLALFLPEIIQAIVLRGIIKLPGVFRTGIQFRQSLETIKKSKYFIFSGDEFDIILYLDFLVLGMLISAEELGIYSEAAIIARFFLLIPISIRPVVRNIYCTIAAKGNNKKLAAYGNRLPAVIFYINGVLALYFLIFFENILTTLFIIPPGGTWPAYGIFVILLPGLLYLASALVKDPFYEAIESQNSLQAIMITIFVVNLFLNFYLVPFAGNKGAATATMLSSLLFFVLCEVGLKSFSRKSFFSWFMAGVWVSLLYLSSGYTSNWPFLTFLAVPLLFFICLFLSGFFDYMPATIEST